MNNMDVDTSKMNDWGYNIISLVNEYEEAINMLYERINNMPTQSQEWVGTSAERFAQKLCKVEKKQYDDLGAALRKYGQLLINTASSIERAIYGNRL